MRYYANKIEIPLEQIAYLDMIMPRSIQSSCTSSQEYKPRNGHPTIIVKIGGGQNFLHGDPQIIRVSPATLQEKP